MCLSPVNTLYFKNSPAAMYVNCGKCLECKIKRSREWSFRLLQESKLYDCNCMITLTYNNDHLPENGEICYRDFQLFMKRLRKFLYPEKVRFFCSAEYGDRGGRPHFHCILFGYDFPDKYFYRFDNKKTELYRSPKLEALWDFGFSSIVDFNQEVGLYCAAYLQKKISGKTPPVIRMSNRPGIGFGAIKKEMLFDEKIYENGKYIALPRYYLKVLERKYPDYVKEFRQSRVDLAVKNYVETDIVSRETENRRRREKFQKIFGKSLDFNNMI